jgi:Na+-driven multidrug efflux pump
MFVMCIGLGIGQGFQPVSSFNYQAKQYGRVKKGLVFTTLVGFAMVFVLATVGFIFAEPIVRLFQEDPSVIKVGAPALRYASVGLLFMPLSIPVNMLYQSIRKAGISSFLSLLRSGLYFIPLLLLGSWVWGLTGIQLAQPLTDVLNGITCIPFLCHFLHKTPNDPVE